MDQVIRCRPGYREEGKYSQPGGSAGTALTPGGEPTLGASPGDGATNMTCTVAAEYSIAFMGQAPQRYEGMLGSYPVCEAISCSDNLPWSEVPYDHVYPGYVDRRYPHVAADRFVHGDGQAGAAKLAGTLDYDQQDNCRLRLPIEKIKSNFKVRELSFCYDL